MKTSNKLLIAFALALILVPILGMVYVSRVNYKDGKGITKEIAYNNEHFKNASQGLTSKRIPTTFKSINIVDAKNLYFSIHLIKDDQLGMKIGDRFKDNISFKIDEQGILQITLDAKKVDKNSYVQLFIYAPNITQLSLANADYLDFHSNIDSLQLDVKNSGTVSLRNKSNMKKLVLTGEDVKSIEFGPDDLKYLKLSLKNSGFESENNSYDELAISTSGNSIVNIKGGENEKEERSIRKLTINTLDVADVKFENIKISTCAGSFSDQTKVQMPAINLKQLYK